jgi:large subunit ribosomal protein L24
MHVKKGDKVKVVAGRDRHLGPAKVLEVIPSRNRVVVEGRNLVTKHVRGNQVLGTESQIVQTEAPIHASNVRLWSEKLGKPVRTQARWVGKDEKLYASKAEAAASYDAAPERIRKVRFAPASEEVFE